jgi:hypothetical protein
LCKTSDALRDARRADKPAEEQAGFVYHLINRGNGYATNHKFVQTVQSLTAVQEFKRSKVQCLRTSYRKYLNRFAELVLNTVEGFNASRPFKV